MCVYVCVCVTVCVYVGYAMSVRGSEIVSDSILFYNVCQCLSVCVGVCLCAMYASVCV